MGIPLVLINGRYDFQAPVENAWEINRMLPDSDLVIINSAGHSPNRNVEAEIVNATDGLS